ncbi:MAG: XTP/dITP diphosphatase [Gammaproteobacteria bacterium]|jgi:XTP/dITP diphosphohydrolase|nr:XTP/dITP diphosphatase [Gammaproteobacteria bacterium]MBT3490498.1 XTP/dITP diphosphatase [Gammaproteobacteria bacterium]MBT3717642.1 XTP/dITP diphosphatase [Gammaproteobacteria bacterium]MBT3844695.1 XTP/dITP diphosphatase [Gammaproteobacteria bacterium]MBT3892114.1 XTP/dITP diphosphatase [Gammaproteobacteria bacterium]
MSGVAGQVVLATGNKGKVRELGQLLANFEMTVIPQTEFNVEEVEETGLTFVENAILKARNAAAHTGLPAIADDSGLEVDYLKGAPGIYSARYAGEDGGDAANNQKLLQALEGVVEAERSARFQCVMVFMRHAEDPVPLVAQGSWEGRILTAPQGENGFGYDPLFWVPQQGCSSAELAAEVKNKLSHRGQALKKLVELLS